MLTSNLILIGFMGSGKSSIGRLLAQKLGYRFVDTDRLVIEGAGMDIARIFATYGETHFRDLETAALESLVGMQRQVIATGGGIVLREGNRQILGQLGWVVGLLANAAVTFKRVSRNTKRPLLHTEDPRGTITRMIAERGSLYENTARFVVDTSVLTPEQIVGIILQKAEELGPALP